MNTNTNKLIPVISKANAIVASNDPELKVVGEYIERFCKTENSIVLYDSNYKISLGSAINYALAAHSKRLIVPDPDRMRQEGYNPYVLQYSLKRRGIKLEFAEERTCPDNIEEILEEYQEFEDMLNHTAAVLNDMTDIHYHN